MGNSGKKRRYDGFMSRQRGASAVEMAVVAPFLVLLLIGVVEASWLIARSIDVSQAAREVGRLAGVNDGDEVAIVNQVCAGMDQPAGAKISFDGAANGLGGVVTATVRQEVQTITGLLDPLFSPPVELSHTTFFRLEQPTATWIDTTDEEC